MDALTWIDDFYNLDRSEGHALCVAHRGGHVWYLGACQALPRSRSRYERFLTSRDPSPPAPAPVVDAGEIARGIALALDDLMERRRQQRNGEG